MTRVLKWEVPVDGETHVVGAGPIALVDHQGDPEIVTVWTIEPDPPVAPSRDVVVVGTGHPLPVEAAEHLGSVCIRTGVEPFNGSLVWHVFEVRRS